MLRSAYKHSEACVLLSWHGSDKVGYPTDPISMHVPSNLVSKSSNLTHEMLGKLCNVSRFLLMDLFQQDCSFEAIANQCVIVPSRSRGCVFCLRRQRGTNRPKPERNKGARDWVSTVAPQVLQSAHSSEEYIGLGI